MAAPRTVPPAAACGLALALALTMHTALAVMPTEMEAFKPVLKGCKLQAPIPSSEQKDLTGSFENEYFFTTGDYVTFRATGTKKRSELRQYDEWSTATKTVRRMAGTVKLGTDISDQMAKYTFMQIHGGEAPLIRVALIGDKDDYTNYIWAVVRTGLGDDDVVNYPLVPQPKGDFESEINVMNNKMQVLIQNKVVLDIDVSSWEKYSNYFKCGSYIQLGDGTADVHFKTLDMTEGGEQAPSAEQPAGEEADSDKQDDDQEGDNKPDADMAADEEPNTEEPADDQSSSDDSADDQPNTGESADDQPNTDETADDGQADDEPSTDESADDEPNTDEPADDGQADDEPSTDESADDQPNTDEPADDGQAGDEQADDEPNTDEPADNEPRTDEPVDDDRNTDESADDEPNTDESADDEPSTDESADDEPSTDESADDQSNTNEPVDDEPSTELAGEEPNTDGQDNTPSVDTTDDDAISTNTSDEPAGMGSAPVSVDDIATSPYYTGSQDADAVSSTDSEEDNASPPPMDDEASPTNDSGCTTNSYTSKYCCLESCGRCGGSGCGDRDGGKDGCCTRYIKKSKQCPNRKPIEPWCRQESETTQQSPSRQLGLGLAGCPGPTLSGRLTGSCQNRLLVQCCNLNRIQSL